MRNKRTAGTTLLALATGLTLALAACTTADPQTGSNDQESAETEQQPVAGGNLTVAIHGDPAAQFDLHHTAADLAALVLRNSFDSLIAQDQDGTFHPWLATRWEVSDDGLEYTFELRDDVTFHDGAAFNAEAVKANFDRVVSPDTGSQYASSLIGGSAYLGTEVLDDYTVQIQLAEPYAPLLNSLSTPYLSFYSPAVIEQHGDQLQVGGPGITVGTGPFILESVVAGQEITFTKNPDYQWAPAHVAHQAAPHLDQLSMRILPDDTTRAGALEAGQIHLATTLHPNSVPTLESSGVEIVSTPAPGIPWSIFLNHSQGVFSDQQVRHAFQLGIDISSAVTSVYGDIYQRAWSVLAPTTPGAYNASLEGTWEHNEEEAARLLDAAGWTQTDSEGYRIKNGERLSATWILPSATREDRETLIAGFQADLRKLGFEVILQSQEGGAYLNDLIAGDYDLIDWSFVRADGDVLRLHLHSELAPIQNASWVNDRELDELTVAASQEVDPETRAELYREIEAAAIDRVHFVPVYVPNQLLGVGTQVHGLDSSIFGWPLLGGVWISE